LLFQPWRMMAAAVADLAVRWRSNLTQSDTMGTMGPVSRMLFLQWLRLRKEQIKWFDTLQQTWL
jgi:hypothetical protein